VDPKFAALVEHLAPNLERLREIAPHQNGALPPDMPKCGVYLFSEGDKHLYVGRSNNMRGRYGRHCLPGATYKQAAFAFILAREQTGNLKAAYRPEGGRAWLMEQPDFGEAFIAAKERIRNMTIDMWKSLIRTDKRSSKSTQRLCWAQSTMILERIEQSFWRSTFATRGAQKSASPRLHDSPPQRLRRWAFRFCAKLKSSRCCAVHGRPRLNKKLHLFLLRN